MFTRGYPWCCLVLPTSQAMSLYLRLLGGDVSLFATVAISEPPLEPRKLHVAEVEHHDELVMLIHDDVHGEVGEVGEVDDTHSRFAF